MEGVEISEEDIKDLTEKLLINDKQYSSHSKPIMIKINSEDEKTILTLVKACKRVLEGISSLPMSKLLAARLLKEAMDQNVYLMCEKMKEYCLDIFKEFALHEKDNPDEKKGISFI
jgi:hypothetical protein